MSEAFQARVDRLAGMHAAHGILLDTNVLLLWLATQLHPKLIGADRLQTYTPSDALLLQEYTGRFGRILTTAHVLAESSNMVGKMVHGRLRDHFFANLFPLFCLDGESSFRQLPTIGRELDVRVFVRLGLTDAGLAALASEDCLLLTDDLDLYVAAVSKGIEALNFTHMREAAGLL